MAIPSTLGSTSSLSGHLMRVWRVNCQQSLKSLLIHLCPHHLPYSSLLRDLIISGDVHVCRQERDPVWGRKAVDAMLFLFLPLCLSSSLVTQRWEGRMLSGFFFRSSFLPVEKKTSDPSISRSPPPLPFFPLPVLPPADSVRFTIFS